MIEGATDPAEVVARYGSFSGDLAFDIGANAGWLASMFAKRFERVVAVEPWRPSFEAMVARRSPRVVPVWAAVSDKSGPVRLDIRSITDAMGELFTPGVDMPGWGEQVDQITVAGTTLDQLADIYDPPDFVKIDTEGHELKVLEGGTAVFDRGPRFLIEVHSYENGEKCRAFLDERGLTYDLIRHDHYNPVGEPWANHYWLVSP